MLTLSQIERLEIMQDWLEEIAESEEFAELDIYPDVTLADALQAVEEILNVYYPPNYASPKPTLHIRTVQLWYEKLKNNLFVTLGSVSGMLVITAALSACASVFCWGVSDAKAGLGYKNQPDFAAQSQIYRGVAIASLAAALGCGVLGSVVNEARK